MNNNLTPARVIISSYVTPEECLFLLMTAKIISAKSTNITAPTVIASRATAAEST